MLDWKKWKGSDLSLMEFLLLNLIYQGAHSKLPFNPKDEIDNKLFEELITKGYIREGFAQYNLSIKAVELFDNENTNFEEFFTLFPQKVPNGQGGERMLRAAKIESKNGSEAFRKWKIITAGNSDKEKHLIKCLNVEIKIRQKQRELQYMHNIITWFNQRKWEFYEHMIDEVINPSNSNEKSI